MTRTPPTTSLVLLLAAGTALSLTGCGASRAYETSAPMAVSEEASPAEEEAAPDDAADGEATAGEGDRVEKKAEGKPGLTPISADEELALEAEQSSDDAPDAPEPAPAAAPQSSEETQRSLLDQLKEEIEALHESLRAKSLSCAGAKPHQDAICSIAERICEMEQPSTTKSQDCKKAEKSCTKAKKRFEDECG